jgi:hypothetical protein
MLTTQERFCLNSTLAGFFLVPFKHDKRRELVAAPSMTRFGGVSRFVFPGLGRFGFVGTLACLSEFSLSLPSFCIVGLFLSTAFVIRHGE